MKENLSDIFSEVNKELLNSTKDKFNKLSSVEKKTVIDNKNKKYLIATHDDGLALATATFLKNWNAEFNTWEKGSWERGSD